ncbi:stressosome-associated protein Prli42 [Rossellomorea aquimaris]|nr:stressosome-associated protein Prli42 [Rossellomorea aquimaris]
MGNKNIRKIIVFIMLFAMLASTLLAGLTFLL